MIIRGLFAIVIAALMVGCGRQSSRTGNGISAVGGPFAHRSMDAIASLDRDCLQYLVSRDSSGVEIWNADYVYFYLVQEKDGALVLDAAGRPLVSGLLHSEVADWMAERDTMPGTSWAWRIQRTAQRVRDGRVISQGAPRIVDDVDLWELLEKDQRAGRGS